MQTTRRSGLFDETYSLVIVVPSLTDIGRKTLTFGKKRGNIDFKKNYNIQAMQHEKTYNTSSPRREISIKNK